MNFLTYLSLRIYKSPVVEGILGALMLIVLVLLSPLILLATPVVWIGLVYEEWKLNKGEVE